MTTELYAEEEVRCGSEDAVQAILHLLGSDSPEGKTYDLAVPFAEIGLPQVGQFSREVEMTTGKPEKHRAIVDLYSTWIPVSWNVPESRMLPAFAGFVEVTPLGTGIAQIAIFGHYTPPGGWVGAGFDAMVGRRIAEATVRQLVDDIKRALEAKR